MKKYNLYWTSCTTHCIDLMFEDIGKRATVLELITIARKIINFIYNHGWFAYENEKGLWWKYCAPEGNKICYKLPRPRKSSKKDG